MRNGGRYQLTLACFAALLVWLVASNGTVAAQEIPALLQVPANIAATHPDIVKTRARIISERHKLHTRNDQLNASCGAAPKGSPKLKSCLAAFSALDKSINRHIRESRAFNRKLKSVIANTLPTVNPGRFISEADYRSAQERLRRLQKFQRDLDHKIAEVRGWRDGLTRDEREFDRMRDDAKTDLAWEFVDHVPVAEGLDSLRNVRALKGVDIGKIKAGYEAVKGIALTGHAFTIEDRQKKAEAIFDGNRALRTAMLDMAHLSERDQKLLTAASKIMDYGATLTVATSGSRPMSDRDKLKTVMMLVETLQPWWGVGVLGENLAERVVQYKQAQKALASLHKAQSTNWSAERYLTDKRNQVAAQSKEVEFIIAKYRLAHHQP